MDDSISRQAAIEKLKRNRSLFCRNRAEFQMLSVTDKSRVDEIDTCISVLLNLPSVQPEIIYCKDCEYTDGKGPIADGRYWCVLHAGFMDFCSDAERRTDE